MLRAQTMRVIPFPGWFSFRTAHCIQIGAVSPQTVYIPLYYTTRVPSRLQAQPHKSLRLVVYSKGRNIYPSLNSYHLCPLRQTLFFGQGPPLLVHTRTPAVNLGKMTIVIHPLAMS